MKSGHRVVEEYMVTENRSLWRDLTPGSDLGENIRKLYEANYKYDMVKQAISREGGVGPTVRRFRNIKEKLAQSAWDLIDAVAPEFQDAFERWLDLHELDDPEKWAKAHLQDRYIQDQLRRADSADGLKRLWGAITQIGGGRRGGGGPDIFKALEGYLFTSESDQFKDYVKQVVQEEMDYAEEDSDRFDYLMDLHQSDEYQEMFNEVVKPIVRGIASDPGAVLDHIMSARMSSLDLESFIQYVLSDHIFPYWKSKWSGEVTQIVDNIEELAQDLESVKRKSLEQAFITINRAIGATHANGSMMEYVQEYNPSVDLALLDDLTAGRFTDEWDQELRDARIPV